MKKFLILVLAVGLLFLGTFEAKAAYTYTTMLAASDASVSTETSYCTAIIMQGYFNLSISGTWTGTVSVERSFDGGLNYHTVEQFTENTQEVGYEPGHGIYYRVGIATGDYGTGTAVCLLSRRRNSGF